MIPKNGLKYHASAHPKEERGVGGAVHVQFIFQEILQRDAAEDLGLSERRAENADDDDDGGVRAAAYRFSWRFWEIVAEAMVGWALICIILNSGQGLHLIL